MFAVVSAIVLGVPFLALWYLAQQKTKLEWREAFALASIGWSAITVLLLTVLSLGAGHDLFAERTGHLTRTWVLVFWTVLAIAGGVVLFRGREVFGRSLAAIRSFWTGGEGRTRFVLIVIVASAAVVGLTAVIAAPNNWDSMNYHLPRVVSWLQLGGIANYATSIEPQLYQPPGSEILITQWHVLVGGDRLDAVVQWFAFVGCMLLGSLAAARLGAGSWGQLLAAFFVATMPLAMLQGSSTQNDLVTAFWLLAAACFAFGPREGKGADLRFYGACLALGLAVLTKGTALIFAVPIGLVLFAARANDRRSLAVVPALIAGLFLVLLPNVPHWERNHQVFGDYIAVGSAGNFYRNDSFGPSTVFSNAVRNASLNAALPVGAANRQLESGVRKLLTTVGVDPDDPGTTFPGRPFAIGKFGPHEDRAGNLALLVLSLCAVIALLLTARFRNRRRLVWAGIVGLQAVLFFAAIKWQAWNVRLQLPLFVLIAPLTAVFLGQLSRQRLVTVAVVLVAIPAPIYMFYNYTRPLVGERSIVATSRASQYFTPRPNIESAYRAAIDKANELAPPSLGLVAGIPEWTYPFWPLRADQKVPVGEILVANPSGRYSSSTLPEVVVCVSCAPDATAYLGARGYKNVPLTIGPARNDQNLNEVPASVSLWRRR